MTDPSRRHWWQRDAASFSATPHLGEHPTFDRMRLDHPDDPSVSVWTDEASNVSRLDPSGAVQVDAEHPTRNWKVKGAAAA
jgi:hypothetical protein